MKIRSISFVFALGCLCTASALATTYTWTGNGSGTDWFQMNNWSPSTGVPGPGDTAIINSPGVGTVLVDQTFTVANLTAISVVLFGGGSLTVSGTLEAQNATLGPAGGTTVTGSLSVDQVPGVPSYNTTYISTLLTLNGSANVSSNAILSINGGVTAINNGFFTLADGAKLFFSSSGAWFINNSSFTSGNAICSSISSSIFSNAPSGMVSANAGKTLQFQSVTLANSGNFQPASGGVINISAVPTALHGGASFTGGGTNLLTGNATLDGTVTVAGNLQLGSASASAGLTLNGTLEVQAGGNLNWLAGTLTGVGTNVTGTIQVDTSATMLMNELGTLTVKNCVLTNNGTLVWTNGGTIDMGYNAQINIGSGKFAIYGDGELELLSSGSPGYNSATLNNYGSLYKYSGVSNSFTAIAVPIHGPGYITAYNGNIQFYAGGDIGYWTVNENCVIALSQGNYYVGYNGYVFSDGSSAVFFPLNGLIVMSPGVNLNIAANKILSVKGSGFQQSGGTIQGNGTLSIGLAGIFTWSAGTIALTNEYGITIQYLGTMNISGAGNTKTIQATGIINYGTINWVNDNGTGGIVAGDGVVFYNAGQFNCQCDAGISDNSTTIHPVFTNAANGVVTKSANTGTTAFGILFVNSGQLQPNKGTLEMVVGYSDPGSFTPASEEISLGGGTLKFDRPVDIHGVIGGYGGLAGTITNENVFEDASVVTMIGNFVNEGKVSLDPSVFAYQGGGNFTQSASGWSVVPIRGTNAANVDFGQLKLDVNYGFVSLGGTLEADITEGYAPPVGASLPFLTSAGRSGTFNNVILPQGMQLNYTPYGATLVVTGTVPVQIISPTVTNGQFQFGFNTISNRSYTVQYEDDLTTGTWTFLTNFIADGSYWQAPPPLPLVPQRYFRVRNP